jgi:hypothetical protein
VVICALAGCGALTAFGQAAAAVGKKVVFSDVKHITEVDDVVGSEIVVEIRAGKTNVVGQWDLYEGYEPLVTPLHGTLQSGVRVL